MLVFELVFVVVRLDILLGGTLDPSFEQRNLEFSCEPSASSPLAQESNLGFCRNRAKLLHSLLLASL